MNAHLIKPDGSCKCGWKPSEEEVKACERLTPTAGVVPHDAHVFEVYAKKPGLPPVRQEVPPCGTRAAYDRHRRLGEDPDEECREANARYNQRRRVGRAV